MARKKKPEEHANHERWMVSYADFITLLFATFTALFAMSNADKAKLEAAAKSIKKAFSSGSSSLFELPSKNPAGGGGSAVTIGFDSLAPFVAHKPGKPDDKDAKPKDEKKEEKDAKDPLGSDLNNLFHGASLQRGTQVGEGSGATPTPTPLPASMKMGTEGGVQNEQLAAEIKELMKDIGLKDLVAVREEKRGTVISLGEAAFFAQGEVEVLPTCIAQLDKIVNALRNKSFEIRVEGHTDNTPVRSGRYRDNLELSTLRASRIVNFMVKEYKMDPTQLSASGYGDTHPIADNGTKEGQQKNRRVDIVILNEQSKAVEPH